jgi:Glucosamine 6-phosphate synthetase, contains amidotransferase and phosphosugar isomerase domains
VAKQLEGAYAIGVISTLEPDKIIGLRKGSPLIVGLGEGENFIASRHTGGFRIHQEIHYS